VHRHIIGFPVYEYGMYRCGVGKNCPHHTAADFTLRSVQNRIDDVNKLESSDDLS
jgi:hypothetical protein